MKCLGSQPYVQSRNLNFVTSADYKSSIAPAKVTKFKLCDCLIKTTLTEKDLSIFEL